MLTDDTHAARLLRLVSALVAHARRYTTHAPELLFTHAPAGWWLALYTGTALVAARVLAFSEIERSAVTVTTDHPAVALLAAPLDGLTLRLADVRRVCDAAVSVGCAASLASVAVDPAELLTALDGLDGETPAVVGQLTTPAGPALTVADLAQRWRVILTERDPRHQLARRVASEITAEVPLDADTAREVLYAIMGQEPEMLTPFELFDVEQLARVDQIRRALRDATVRVIL